MNKFYLNSISTMNTCFAELDSHVDALVNKVLKVSTNLSITINVTTSELNNCMSKLNKFQQEIKNIKAKVWG